MLRLPINSGKHASKKRRLCQRPRLLTKPMGGVFLPVALRFVNVGGPTLDPDIRKATCSSHSVLSQDVDFRERSRGVAGRPTFVLPSTFPITSLGRVHPRPPSRALEAVDWSRFSVIQIGERRSTCGNVTSGACLWMSAKCSRLREAAAMGKPGG